MVTKTEPGIFRICNPKSTARIHPGTGPLPSQASANESILLIPRRGYGIAWGTPLLGCEFVAGVAAGASLDSA